MKLFRYLGNEGPRLGVETAKGTFDLTGAAPEVFGSIQQWLSQGEHPIEVLKIAAASAEASGRKIAPTELLCPIDSQELWGAGVTYERSKVARMEESESGGDFYDKVYVADRPEIFFKSNPRRVSGPGKPIRIRRDSTWDVPEPELTLVVAPTGKIVGYTVGNDVSSRSIEGVNPLYLPQAKTYDGCAAVGPMIRIVDDGVNLRNLDIRLKIERAGSVVFDDGTSTTRMKRTPEELVEFLFREASFPEGVFYMTGTGIVPPDSFTLKSGDIVHITIGEAGTLTNPVA